TFHIYLPRVADALESTARVERQHPLEISRGSETVLLVEDDPGVITLVGTSLRQAGYTVLEAVHGEQALAIERRHDAPIHLLLTDVVMPGINGRVLSERITAMRPDTRVLFMSGYPDDAVVRHGIRTDGAQFIQKPFSLEALAAKIRGALATIPSSTVLGTAGAESPRPTEAQAEDLRNFLRCLW